MIKIIDLKKLNKIKEKEFLNILGLKYEFNDKMQELDKFEFNFKSLKKLLKEIEEIKKLDKSNKNFFLFYNSEKNGKFITKKENNKEYSRKGKFY